MKNILFDLDGTLTDPKIGITKSVAYSLNKFGIPVEDLDTLTKFIGPPLKQSFIDFYGFSDEKADTAVSYYREYFSDKGLFENTVYEGIPELLAKLKAEGNNLIVATSKPTMFAIQILEHFDLLRYFTYVAGSKLDGSRVDKCDVISYALLKTDITDLSTVIMIGDRRFDVEGAKQVGVTSIGVLYGHGEADEITATNPDHIATDVADLESILRGII